MISPTSQARIRIACLAAFAAGVTGVRADEVSPPAMIEPVPAVALPVTVPRRVPRVIALAGDDGGSGAAPVAAALPDPLQGTPAIKPEATGADAAVMLDSLLPGRTDSAFDWYAPVEPLHRPCEPMALAPCVPPPPCHPSEPPDPYDLVGVAGCPSGGPIYRGPCAPRAGTPHAGPFAWYHRLHDRFVDRFYMWK